METVKERWGMACPKCGDDEHLQTTANYHVHLTHNGWEETGDEGDIDLERVWVNCANCGHYAQAHQFQKAAADPFAFYAISVE